MGNPSFQELILKEDPPVLRVSLNSRAPLNAITPSLIREFHILLDRYIHDSRFHFLLLSSENPKAFCAGADITTFAKLSPEAIHSFIRDGQRLTLRIEESPWIVLVLIHGPCLGGGFELALSGDFLIAVESSILGLPEVSLGIMPGFGGTVRLARSVGVHRALSLTLTAQKFTGKEGKEWGILYETVKTKEDLIPASERVLETLKKLGPQGLSLIKKQIRESVSLPLSTALLYEFSRFIEVVSTEEAKEGISAFLEKREPRFYPR